MQMGSTLPGADPLSALLQVISDPEEFKKRLATRQASKAAVDEAKIQLAKAKQDADNDAEARMAYLARTEQEVRDRVNATILQMEEEQIKHSAIADKLEADQITMQAQSSKLDGLALELDLRAAEIGSREEAVTQAEAALRQRQDVFNTRANEKDNEIASRLVDIVNRDAALNLREEALTVAEADYSSRIEKLKALAGSLIMGDVHFYMLKPREIRRPRADGLPGALLGRFLPDVEGQPLSYRITPANYAHVEQWVAEGAAAIGVRSGSAVSLGITVRGTVKTEGDK